MSHQNKISKSPIPHWPLIMIKLKMNKKYKN